MPHTPGALTRQIHGKLLAAGKMKPPTPLRQNRRLPVEPGPARPSAAKPDGPLADAPWRGSVAKKPWHYRVTAVIPHRGTLEHLELCLQFLAQQSERPYVMIIDAGSNDESFAPVLALRSETVEVHRIACHATEEYADAACYAMDLAMSACRGEYLWCLHSDCFITNSNMLAELLVKADGGRQPVIGYESISAREHPECKGMVSDACTLLHMPTMRRLDVTWSRAGLAERAQAAGQTVVFGSEMSLNYRLRDNGVKPLILGSEKAGGVERDANRVHLRSATFTEQIVAGGKNQRAAYQNVLNELKRISEKRALTGSARVFAPTGARSEFINIVRRPERIALRSAVVAACDDAFFAALELMVASLMASHDCRVIVIDLGLRPEQAAWCKAWGAEVVAPDHEPMPRNVDHWQTWNKPAYIMQLRRLPAPPERAIWIDADCIIVGSLADIDARLDEAPFVHGDFISDEFPERIRGAAINRNKPNLYAELPVGEWRVEHTVNAGVLGFDLERDQLLLSTYRSCVACAAARPAVRESLSWWDQGALLWALERLEMKGAVVDDVRFNAQHALPQRPLLLGEVTATLRNLLERKDWRPHIIHAAGVPKPYGWKEPIRVMPHEVGRFRRDLALFVLGHDKAALAESPKAPNITVVDLAEIDRRNDLAENRIYQSDILEKCGADYIGLCSQSWHRKYVHCHGIERLQELELAPHVVYSPSLTTFGGGPTGREWLAETARWHPGLEVIVADYGKSQGMASEGLSLWCNNFIAHRSVVLDLVRFWRRAFSDLFGKFGWNPPFDISRCDASRTWGYLGERITVLYFANRTDLELRPVPR